MVCCVFQGAKACFLRDIPFSMIYFTVYAHMKQFTGTPEGYNNPATLLLSATVAGDQFISFLCAKFIFNGDVCFKIVGSVIAQ